MRNFRKSVFENKYSRRNSRIEIFNEQPPPENEDKKTQV